MSMNMSIFDHTGRFIRTLEVGGETMKQIIGNVREHSYPNLNVYAGNAGVQGDAGEGGEPIRITEARIHCCNGITIDYDFADERPPEFGEELQVPAFAGGVPAPGENETATLSPGITGAAADVEETVPQIPVGDPLGGTVAEIEEAKTDEVAD